MSSENKPVCFVISPIGRVGTETFDRFKEVLDYVIRPAAAQSGFDLEVIRADDIERPGSFIKDILQQLLDAYVVVADLTTQNPNVFYELGVRHALSPRTILIAQSVDDIPSDLREYRTIVYDTSARGAATFSERFRKFLSDIHAGPHRADNPVLDRLGSIIDRQTAVLQEEVGSLKTQLESVLRKGNPPTPSPRNRPVAIRTRVDRILTLHGAERQILDGRLTYGTGDKQRSVRLPASQGEFGLYFLADGNTVKGCLYLALSAGTPNFDHILADARVLMGPRIKGLETGCTFVIATNENCSKEKPAAERTFAAMKKYAPAKVRSLLLLDVWDDPRLTELERDLGIRIDAPVAT